MKYLRKFQTLTDYNTATINRPSVSLISTGNELKYDPLLSPGPANNEIWYTGEYYDMEKVIGVYEQFGMTYTGPTILSNQRVGNKYVVTFDGPVTSLGIIMEGGVPVGIYPLFMETEDGSFEANTKVTSVQLPSSITDIGVYCFAYCTALTSVNIPNGVLRIWLESFCGCASLLQISIPNTTTLIGGSAFYYCSSLTSITIPASVTSIEEYAFNSCSGVESINVDSNNLYYDSRNNCNALIETSSNTLLTGCKNTTIPNTVTSIYANAFHQCSGLTTIIIPSSIISIGNEAFSGCEGLTSITCNATTPPTLSNSSDAFNNTNDCPIYVPSQSVDTYKSTSGWSVYATRIQAIP